MTVPKGQSSGPVSLDYTRVTDTLHGLPGGSLVMADMSPIPPGTTPTDPPPSALLIGSDHTAAPHCVVVQLDPKQGTLTSTPIEFPVDPETTGLSATRVGNSVLVFGGCKTIDGSVPHDVFSRSLYRCSVTSHSWEKVKVASSDKQSPKARSNHSAFSLGGKLYIAGGFRGGYEGVRDCWSYSPATARWHRERDCPVAFMGAVSVVVDGRAHILGGDIDPDMHISFTKEDGWVREKHLPFIALGAPAMQVKGSIIVFGGVIRPPGSSLHTGLTHHYDTGAKEWVIGETVPWSLGLCCACAIGSSMLLSGGGTLLLTTVVEPGVARKGGPKQPKRVRHTARQDMRDEDLAVFPARSQQRAITKASPPSSSETHREVVSLRRELSIVESEMDDMETEADAMRDKIGTLERTVQIFAAWGREVATRTEVPWPQEIVPPTYSAALALTSFSEAQTVAVAGVLERVKGCDVDKVVSHITTLQKHMDMARDLHPAMTRLQQFVTAHPFNQVQNERCSVLRGTLRDLLSVFTPLFQERLSLQSDPRDSVSELQAASSLLEDIDALHPVQMPRDTTGLTLSAKRVFFLAETYNADLRSVYVVAGPLISAQSAIESAVSGISKVEVPDPAECKRVHTEALTLHKALKELAPNQERALQALKRYQGMSLVTPKQVAVAAYQVELQQVKARDPTLSAQQAKAVNKELARLQERLGSLKRAQQEREKTLLELEKYKQFPEVRAALSGTVLECGGEGKQGAAKADPGEIVRASAEPVNVVAPATAGPLESGGWKTQGGRKKGRKGRRH
ncbi:hypothetical protein KIPB_007777 [Kipferlia bialata]|uniref:Uncharacterized protein n=1 Tax=Kipferlia bialata TaxID=797122 RepID=A0A9K3GJC1_9EUKA|nr:hypothetical protein KIPB_007777 [Kipferlia bialata]|eukprot:g7777.t1